MANSRSCTKTAKPRITITTPYDSTGTLVFRRQKYRRNSSDVTPQRGRQIKVGFFEQYLVISQKRCKLGTYFLRKVNRKLELISALSNGAIFNDLEWPLTTPNHPIFYILRRLSYFRNGWRQALQIWWVGLSYNVQASRRQTIPERDVVRVTWRTSEFYTPWNILGTAKATCFKFQCTVLSREVLTFRWPTVP